MGRGSMGNGSPDLTGTASGQTSTATGGTGRARHRVWLPALAAGVVLLAAACTQETPAALNGSLLPAEPRTVEVVLPWSTFGDSVSIIGGYGSPNDLPGGLIANQYQGQLDARALVRIRAVPRAFPVRDSTGTTRTDSSFTYLSGRLVALVDTLQSRVTGPVEVAVSYLEDDWHSATATWDFLVDSVGTQQAWTEPGAGPATLLGTAIWDPAESDSVVFPLDSAQVAILEDDSVAVRRSLRFDMLTVGGLAQLSGAALRVDARPSINQDTTIVLSGVARQSTFIFTPEPGLPAAGLRAGGAPAYRSILVFNMPTELNGPPEFCALVECPFTLTPEALNSASLILTTATTSPSAFQPTDSLRLDVRRVLVPSLLPKSPLGPSFFGILGAPVGADAFQDGAGVEIPITVTSFIRDLLDPETGAEEPNQLALISAVEPASFFFGDFVGPGGPGEPRLRLILTDIDPLEAR